MGRKNSGSYHHGDLARALVDAAVEVLEEKGIAGLSLREVARRANVSHAAPAHHFGDRAGLLTAVATEGHRRFAAALSAALTRAHGDPRAAFTESGRAYVRFAVAHRGYFELMFRPEHLDRDDLDLKHASQHSFQLLLDGVKAAQQQGLEPERDPRDVALTAWACVHGLATLWLDGNLAESAGMTLEEALDRVLPK